MILNFKYITRVNLPIAILLSAVALGGWIPDFLSGSTQIGALVATMLLTLVNGWGMMYLLYTTSITRYREPLPVVLYLWATVAFPELHPLWDAQLAVLTLIFTVIILHYCYHKTDSQEQVFLATGLLLIGSLCVPELVWYIPLLWAALIFQQALSIRSLLASWVAIGCFALYYAIAYYFMAEWPLYTIPMPAIPQIMSDSTLLITLITVAVALLMGLYFSGHLLWRLYRESNRMRFMVILHIILLIAGAVWALMPAGDWNGLSLLIYPFAMLATLFFQQKESVFRSIVFLLLMALYITAYIL